MDIGKDVFEFLNTEPAPRRLDRRLDPEHGDGLVVVGPDQVNAVLDPLPVAVIPGIGKQTLARLQAIGVHTISELRHAPDRDLEPVFGRFTRKTRERASGIDDRPVVASRGEKSISNEQTYDTDLCDRSDMERQLLRLTERTAGRLRKAALSAGTVQVKIRQSDFRTFTRQKRLTPPGNGTDQIFELARAMLRDWLARNPGARIRLLGVGGSKLAPAGQDDLFAGQDATPGSGVDSAVDEIRDRFGNTALGRARTLDRP